MGRVLPYVCTLNCEAGKTCKVVGRLFVPALVLGDSLVIDFFPMAAD